MQLSQLFHYPVKSCAGFPLTQASAQLMGLEGDRCWMVADSSGKFITGRQWPRMVLIRPNITPTGLRLEAPDMEPIEVSYRDYVQPQASTVWSYAFQAWGGSAEVDDWLSFFLGTECRLLYIGQQSQRLLRSDESKPLAFADGYQYLLIGEHSLADLNQRLPDAVPMLQFRPNLVVSGAEAFAEDEWKVLRIGSVVFDVVKPCERCIFTTVDPESGQMHPQKQPLVTLNQYRAFPAGTLFGQNLVARNSGLLMLGDEVEVLA